MKLLARMLVVVAVCLESASCAAPAISPVSQAQPQTGQRVTYSGYLVCQVVDVGLGPQVQWTLFCGGSEYEVAVDVTRCTADARRFERCEVSAEGMLIQRNTLPPLLVADRIGAQLPGDHALALLFH